MAAMPSSPTRPRVVPLYDPQRTDITSEAWPFDRNGRFVYGSQVESIEEEPLAQAIQRRPNARQIDQRRRRRTLLASLTTSVHGESQLLVPSYSNVQDAELTQFYRSGPPSHAPMELPSPQSPAMDEESEEPPGEGTLAWLHCLAGFLVILNAQGLNQSYGVFQAYYQGVLLPNKSPATIAWIGSFQIFLLFFATIIVSPLLDKGHWRSCFNGGSLLLVLSVLITSWCTQWWQLLLVQGILTGLAMGLIYGSGVIILMSYFNRSKRLGIATGIPAAGGPVGGMVYPAVAEKLVFKLGYPWTMRLIGLMVFISLIPANIIVRQKQSWKRKEKPKMDLTIFRDTPFLYMTAGLVFAMWGIYFGLYFLVTYAQSTLHLTSTSSINLLILLNASNLPGRLLPALISDTCLGPLNALLPLTLLTAFALFLWIACTTHTSLTYLACFLGFSTGGVQGLYNAVIWEFSMPKSGGGVEEAGRAGVRVAFVFAGMGVATLTGAPVGGALVGKMDGGYLGAQMFAGGSVLVGFSLLVAARWAREGWGPVRV